MTAGELRDQLEAIPDDFELLVEMTLHEQGYRWAAKGDLLSTLVLADGVVLRCNERIT